MQKNEKVSEAELWKINISVNDLDLTSNLSACSGFTQPQEANHLPSQGQEGGSFSAFSGFLREDGPGLNGTHVPKSVSLSPTSPLPPHPPASPKTPLSAASCFSNSARAETVETVEREK